MDDLPILYSFRRCPYAMRARLGLNSAAIQCELREVVLRDKPAAMLDASPKGTVPVLISDTGVIDESLNIMLWALGRNDPEGWLRMPDEGHELISRNDGPFKSALDRYKYASRHAGSDPLAERARASAHLADLDARLRGRDWLFGDRPSLADMASITFVRQFAFVDRAWFDAQTWLELHGWLDRFLASPRFAAIMVRPPAWRPGDKPILLS